jgi:hypothetical protein
MLIKGEVSLEETMVEAVEAEAVEHPEEVVIQEEVKVVDEVAEILPRLLIPIIILLNNGNISAMKNVIVY